MTTWSQRGLRWSGFLLRDVHEQLIAPHAHPDARCNYVLFRGLDRYRTCLPLDDALAADVLLADQLDGAPLSLAHGAPLRVVAPAHYGYKSVKHLCAIEIGTRHRAGSAGPMEHPRGRVALEERSAFLPGWFWRRVFRATVPYVLWLYRRSTAPQRTGGAQSE